MRTVAILILVIAFFMAVILPNEVGTHELPAMGAKQVLTKAHPHWAKPVKAGPANVVILADLQGETGPSRCNVELSRSMRTVCNRQLSLPLSI